MDEIFEYKVRNLIVTLCEVMFANGYKEVSIGSLMRLIGCKESVSKKLDNRFIVLDEDFLKYAAEHRILNSLVSESNVTIH